MPLELKKVTSYVVYVNEREFFVDIVLRDVDVEVIVTILIKTTLLRPWSDIRSHRIRNDCASNRYVLPEYFGQRRMLTIRNVIKERDLRRSTRYAKYSVYFTGKNCTLGKLLPSKSCLIYLYRTWKDQVGQHFCFDEKTASLPH